MRYHGILAPAAAFRPLVVPKSEPADPRPCHGCTARNQTFQPPEEGKKREARPRNYRWVPPPGGVRTLLAIFGSLEDADQLYEAARIDGAGRVQQFRFITIPLLSPTIYLVAVLAIIQSFQVFTHAYILTGC